jgi:hypothetical protein
MYIPFLQAQTPFKLAHAPQHLDQSPSFAPHRLKGDPPLSCSINSLRSSSVLKTKQMFIKPFSCASEFPLSNVEQGFANDVAACRRTDVTFNYGYRRFSSRKHHSRRDCTQELDRRFKTCETDAAEKL